MQTRVAGDYWPKSLACRVVNQLMAPRYNEGDTVYYCPDRPVKLGCGVVARRRGDPDDHICIRQVADVDGVRHLVLLNPEYEWWTSKLDEQWEILGVVTGRLVPEDGCA